MAVVVEDAANNINNAQEVEEDAMVVPMMDPQTTTDVNVDTNTTAATIAAAAATASSSEDHPAEEQQEPPQPPSPPKIQRHTHPAVVDDGTAAAAYVGDVDETNGTGGPHQQHHHHHHQSPIIPAEVDSLDRTHDPTHRPILASSDTAANGLLPLPSDPDVQEKFRLLTLQNEETTMTILPTSSSSSSLDTPVNDNLDPDKAIVEIATVVVGATKKKTSSVLPPRPGTTAQQRIPKIPNKSTKRSPTSSSSSSSRLPPGPRRLSPAPRSSQQLLGGLVSSVATRRTAAVAIANRTVLFLARPMPDFKKAHVRLEEQKNHYCGSNSKRLTKPVPFVFQTEQRSLARRKGGGAFWKVNTDTNVFSPSASFPRTASTLQYTKTAFKLLPIPEQSAPLGIIAPSAATAKSRTPTRVASPRKTKPTIQANNLPKEGYRKPQSPTVVATSAAPNLKSFKDDDDDNRNNRLATTDEPCKAVDENDDDAELDKLLIDEDGDNEHNKDDDDDEAKVLDELLLDDNDDIHDDSAAIQTNGWTSTLDRIVGKSIDNEHSPDTVQILNLDQQQQWPAEESASPVRPTDLDKVNRY